ncbi:pyridoxine/pyridoxamine 5'-phosphate oxidase [Oerskovia flava]|uniref:pyridoxine/pyridoxamine 5'-phosphate oxidase n=1 Tax=Oerskovia flava TaxID=2986422 RepID=UPI0022407947|nr:pyridoxal 5'-phosphate synthase [Oerskovia sp. JB1-3-2]
MIPRSPAAPTPSLRERLRGAARLGADLPAFDPRTAPRTPTRLFLTWLDDAIDAGVVLPHAATLSTADSRGQVDARTLLLKDVAPDVWFFATHRDSPKGRDLAENPRAAMTFFWRELGRQVRLTGPVAVQDPEAGAADFLARPEGSRAETLVAHQSEPLASLEEYRDAYDAALGRVRAEPGTVAETWTSYALVPTSVEFWAATGPHGQVRLRYSSGTDPHARTWRKSLLYP